MMSQSCDDLSRLRGANACAATRNVHLLSNLGGGDSILSWIKAPLAAALILVAIASPAAAASNGASQFPARILAVHNAARAQAGVAPLAWDPALGDAAAS